MTAKAFVRPALAFAAAVLATAILGSLVQTQVNIAAIESVGPAVPAGLRAATSAEDLVRFGPVMASIAAAALLPAFAAGAVVAWAFPRGRIIVYAFAGAAGLWAAFALMGLFTPMPTLVAAARGTAGLAALCVAGLVGGLIFAYASRRRVDV